MKARNVVMDVWGWDGTIVVGGSFRQFGHFLMAHIQEAPLAFGAEPTGYAHLVMAKPWVLWVPTLKDVSIVAHEALHIACGVLSSRGVTLSEDSEEAYTYTMQQVIRAAYEKKGWKQV